MKLPEKLREGEFGKWSASGLPEIRASINQLIDYLAEKEEYKEDMTDDEYQKYIDFRHSTGGKPVNYTVVVKAGEEQKTVTLPKPKWWNDEANIMMSALTTKKEGYRAALEDTSKAMGVIIKLED